MSRLGAGDTVVQKATNNVYTALTAAAVVAAVLGLVALFMRSKEIFGGNGLF